ncbi:MAG: 3-oxoacyl-[acyl-carrier protein] reductase [Rhodothermales bacterium]|jgi:3-oxoacyl-[acyl-carrier protein] reductase
MSTPQLFTLPKLYENMDEATLGEWMVEEGAEIAKGAPLVELVTDKTILEYESPASGVLLKIYAPTRSVVPVGYVLAAIGEAGSEVPDVAARNDALTAEFANAGGEPLPVPIAKPAAKKRRVAPAARALAKKHGIDLSAIVVGDRPIHKGDIEAYIASQAPSDADEPAAEPTSGKKVALITGATGSIGRAIAARLAADGWSLALHFHANAEAAAELLGELRNSKVNCASFQADLRNADSANQMVEAVIARFGQVDLLVNNAGILRDGLVSMMATEQWDTVINTNLNAVFYVTRPLVMHMARRRSGRVISISSDAGRLGGAGRANYSASKAGLAGFSRALARELGASGVCVNTVSPGFIESEMTAGIPDTKRRELMKHIPLRRFGQPEQVADLIVFLASPAAAYITGQEISVDGGLFMG